MMYESERNIIINMALLRRLVEPAEAAADSAHHAVIDGKAVLARHEDSGEYDPTIAGKKPD